MEVKFSEVRTFAEDFSKNARKFANTDAFRLFVHINLGLYALYGICAILSHFRIV